MYTGSMLGPKMAARHTAPMFFGDMARSSLGCLGDTPACISGRKKLEGKRYHSFPWLLQSFHDMPPAKLFESTIRTCKGGWYDMVLPYTKTIGVGARQI